MPNTLDLFTHALSFPGVLCSCLAGDEDDDYHDRGAGDGPRAPPAAGKRTWKELANGQHRSGRGHHASSVRGRDERAPATSKFGYRRPSWLVALVILVSVAPCVETVKIMATLLPAYKVGVY